MSRVDDAPLEALANGASTDASAALRALLEARGKSGERAAIGCVMRARAAGRGSDALYTAAAALLQERGEAALAIRLLDGVASNDGLLLLADLNAERSDLPRALAIVERVLSRDLDVPGARERHQRWRVTLGGPIDPLRSLAPAVLPRPTPETAFVIVGEAARGGAGVVYEAIDESLGRRVAFKVYHRPTEEREKLLREARVAVALAGRGVVRIFDADPARGFVVMEWVAQGSLERWLRAADLEVLIPVERWLGPLAAAVARVHSAGLAHGDLKPANVLLRAPGEPVLSDFGCAGPPGAAAAGTLGFLSPERILARTITPADDVYALGRILERALDALGEHVPDTDARRLRDVARHATGPASERPNAVDLLRVR